MFLELDLFWSKVYYHTTFDSSQKLTIRKLQLLFLFYISCLSILNAVYKLKCYSLNEATGFNFSQMKDELHYKAC